MNKFIVNNILIEKSERDIKTGNSLEFTNGFNFICGNNEAGKSSIMNFLKESFFLEKGTETGKIFFEIDENGKNKKYRADIKPSSKKSDRCVLFDEENNSVNYSFVEEYIKQNYFKAGFTINLDDLNSLNDGKIDLVNVIKDPFNDKLGACLLPSKAEIDNYLGVDLKPKKELKDLIAKVKNINSQIIELSQKEGEYNSIVEKINLLNLEIDEIKNVINYLNISKNLNKLKEEIIVKKDDLEIQEKSFNKKLFENKEKTVPLFNDAVKYKSNLSIKDKKEQEIQFEIEKIKDKFSCLVNQFGIVLSENDIQNIIIENDKNCRINELIEKNKELLFDIKAKTENKKTYQNEISQLQNLPAVIDDVEKLKDLQDKIEQSSKTVNYLRDEIEKLDKNIIASKSNKINIPVIISMSIMFIFAIVATVLAMINKIDNPYSLVVVGIIFILSHYISLNLNKNKNDYEEEKTRKEEQKDKVLLDLKQEIGNFYPNVDFNFINQIEAINYSLNTLLSKKNLLIQVENELSELNKQLSQNQQEIETLKIEQFKNISDDKYLEIIALVASIKEEIKNRNELKTEIEIIEKENSIVLDNFKDFVLKNDLTMPLSFDFDENIKILNEQQEKNNETKSKINYLIEDIEKKEKEIQEIIQKEAELLNKIDVVIAEDIEEQIKKIEEEKNIKEEEKQNLQVEKSKLEEFEGLADKKIEKNLLLDEYRQIVKKLMVNQLSLNLVEIAKGNFNQTQPDLVNAQKYLSILTGGKYSKINLELQEISNEENSLIKKWDILSRGTKEQLYLALRLGYASNYSNKNNKPNLPLIIDDAFVNFDVLRTKNALSCLNEFAKTNQVLFFTCHTEQMQNLLKDLKIKDVNILTI